MNYCYLLATHPICSPFDPSLLGRLSGNPLLPLGNPLRPACRIFQYEFLDSPGVTSSNLLSTAYSPIFRLRNNPL